CAGGLGGRSRLPCAAHGYPARLPLLDRLWVGGIAAAATAGDPLSPATGCRSNADGAGCAARYTRFCGICRLLAGTIDGSSLLPGKLPSGGAMGAAATHNRSGSKRVLAPYGAK